MPAVKQRWLETSSDARVAGPSPEPARDQRAATPLSWTSVRQSPTLGTSFSR